MKYAKLAKKYSYEYFFALAWCTTSVVHFFFLKKEEKMQIKKERSGVYGIFYNDRNIKRKT